MLLVCFYYLNYLNYFFINYFPKEGKKKKNDIKKKVDLKFIVKKHVIANALMIILIVNAIVNVVFW